jgi:hypothetical protein
MWTFNKLWNIVTPEEAKKIIESQSNEIDVPKNLELLGNSPDTTLSDSNIQLIGAIPKKKMDTITETFSGAEPLRISKETNVGDMIIETNDNLRSLGNEKLDGKEPIKDITNTNVNLTGSEPLLRILDNVEFENLKKVTQTDKNFSLLGASPLKTMSNNVDFKGNNSSEVIRNIENIEFKKPKENKRNSYNNVNLKGQLPQQNMSENIDLDGKDSLKKLTYDSVDLKGQLPQIDTIKNKNVFGDNKFIGVQKKDRNIYLNKNIEFKNPNEN